MDELEEIRAMIARLTNDMTELMRLARGETKPVLWTVKDVCEYGHCGRTYVMDQLRRGRFPGAVKEGRKWLFEPEEVIRHFGHTNVN